MTIRSAKIRSQIIASKSKSLFSIYVYPCAEHYVTCFVSPTLGLNLFILINISARLIFQLEFPNFFWLPANQEQQDCISSWYYLSASPYPECCKSILNMGHTRYWKKTVNRCLKFDKILDYVFTLVPKRCVVALRNECTWGRQRMVVSFFIYSTSSEGAAMIDRWFWSIPWTRSRSIKLWKTDQSTAQCMLGRQSY